MRYRYIKNGKHWVRKKVIRLEIKKKHVMIKSMLKLGKDVIELIILWGFCFFPFILINYKEY